MNKENIANVIIVMEKFALEEWNKGNPSGYLDIYASNITYFDPFLEKRIDGIERMRNFYETLRGKIAVDKYEMINPCVEVSEEMAVLSYNLYSYLLYLHIKRKCNNRSLILKIPDRYFGIQ